MRIYKYGIETKLILEVVGKDGADAVRNLKGLREEIKNLLKKLGVEMEGEDNILWKGEEQ